MRARVPIGKQITRTENSSELLNFVTKNFKYENNYENIRYKKSVFKFSVPYEQIIVNFVCDILD
ncbi:MAG: hypothetical protein LBE18_01790 [Planctomycetaceae bacterium]|nr:hypothetical protein [Planctomycetaceae bacterium]